MKRFDPQPQPLEPLVHSLELKAILVVDDDKQLASALQWILADENFLVDVAFDVIDHGPGVPDDDRERIFERFQQRESSMTHTEGFGLGLYITKLLTEAMGGWIDVDSSVGGGSTFTVTLPATRNLPAPARPPAPAHADRTAS